VEPVTDVSTPVLADLVGGFVNEHLFQRYGDVPTAVDAFLAERQETAARLPGEIARVLVELPTEEAVGDHLDQLGVGFVADPVRGGYRGWLVEVSRRARTAG
jgi:hypothetical protein